MFDSLIIDFMLSFWSFSVKENQNGHASYIFTESFLIILEYIGEYKQYSPHFKD